VEPRDERTEGRQTTTNVDDRSESTGGASAGAEEANRAERVELFENDERDAFSQRWSTIQRSFVDEPQRSVEQANALVADLMDRVVSSFRDERSRREEQWGRGEEVTTEDLRIILQRYRSFFSRLLEF
jgi:hypothetical protein